MKRPKKFKPDYQVLGSDGQFSNGGGMALFTSAYFKPCRLLAIPNQGLVVLMVSFAGDQWIIFSLDKDGTPARSKIFKLRSVGEVMFREVVARLTEADKDALAAKLADERLPVKERFETARELGRLMLADDELSEGITEMTRQFCASHTEEEIAQQYQKELAAYDERRASGGEDE